MKFLMKLGLAMLVFGCFFLFQQPPNAKSFAIRFWFGFTLLAWFVLTSAALWYYSAAVGWDFHLEHKPQRGKDEHGYPSDQSYGQSIEGLSLAWVEQQPSYLTWERRYEGLNGLHKAEGFVGANLIFQTWIGLPIVFGNADNSNFVLSFFVPFTVAFLFGHMLKPDLTDDKRSNIEPIPIFVERWAFIEKRDGEYWFVVVEKFPDAQARVAVRGRWSAVGTFSRTDYLSAFHSGQKVDFPLRYWAVVTQADAGGYWLISPTVEGENAVLNRVTQLNHVFGPAARQSFLEREQIRARGAAVRPTSSGTGTSAPQSVPPVSDVPPKFE